MEPIASLPEGTVTFLFTDIEGSTRLLQRLGEGYAAVLNEHRRLLREALRRHAGYELGTEGDSFFVVFPRATDAVAAAVAGQRALGAHPWPEGAQVRVRMGLHTGTPTLTLGEYVGLDVHRAARIANAGHGGQILLSQMTRDLVADDLPDGVTLRDVGSHRLKDLQQPEHLFQVMIADLADVISLLPLRSLESVSHNLPIQLTSFIGREQEMAAVKELLSSSRLLTLTGAGGCGKTRLALQVAAERVEEYPDGVWLVELAALSDPALVAHAVASVLGVREEGARPLPATLTDALRSKRLLLILDNCEHLVGACAGLVEGLLRVCPHLQVLATSREGLGVPGEVAWVVPSLATPGPEHLPPAGEGRVAALTQYAAVRLFIDRARLSQPRFAVTNENAEMVAQVCGRLDGIPLALELAAARVKVLSVEQIAERLDDRFRLLTGGSRTGLPRHQTLRATMDWSYDLLSEAERLLLCRLSVFAGGWTLEAAEAICGDDVLDLLSRLVDRSLVVVEEQGGEVRYRLLETIRQYGAEKVAGLAEGSAVREQHRDWFLSLAERAEAELRGPEQEEWLGRLATEHDNLRAAMGWSVERKEAEPGLRLAGALWRFWEVRGHLTEGSAWLQRTLSVGSSGAPGAPAALRAKALSGAGTMAWAQGDYDQAVSLHEEALALYRAVDDTRGVAFSLLCLGAQALQLADYERAVLRYEESLTRYRDVGDTWGIAAVLGNLGVAALYQGDYGRARALYEESLALYRQLGDQRWIACSIHNLGEAAHHQGDDESAKAFQKESLALFVRLGDKRGIAAVLEALAGIFAAQQQAQRAARLFGAAEALRDAIHVSLPLSDPAVYRRSITATREALDEPTFAAAWAEGRQMTVAQALADASETADDITR